MAEQFDDRWFKLSNQELEAIASGKQISNAEDIAKSGAAGLARGALSIPGFIGDISELGAQGINAATSFIGKQFGQDWSNPGLDKPPETRGGPIAFPTTRELEKGVEQYTGEFHKPQTTAGRYAERIGEFIPGGVAFGPGNIPRRVLSQALAPAAGSIVAEDSVTNPALKPYAALGGAVAGGALPGVLARGANPLHPSAERQRLADTLDKEGIPYTAGQMTGNPLVKALESPFGTGNNEVQLDKLGEAAMRKAGQTGKASRENVAKMEESIGKRFDELEARHAINLDPPLIQEMVAARDKYYSVVPPSLRKPMVEKFQVATDEAISSGKIPGDTYRKLRTELNEQIRSSNDGDYINLLRDWNAALDSAMERSIAASNNPADLGAWQQVRNDYRNSLVIKHAQGRGGEAQATGQMTPGSLDNAVTVLQGRNNRAKGVGDFADLSDAASILKPLPNSGTPVRTIAAGLGGLAGAKTGDASLALAGAAAGYHAVQNPLTQNFLMGRLPGQRSLENLSSKPSIDALAQALMRTPRLVQTPDGFSYYTDDPR